MGRVPAWRLAMTSWRGEFTDQFFAQPPADPIAFGMPVEDDGSRANPLLSADGTFTGRSAVAAAELLGRHATVFPSHHGGFVGGGSGYAGQPEAFARRLRDVLDEH